MGMTKAIDRPVWVETGVLETEPLSADTACDVCVVGAGMAGILTAERLAREGMNVVVVDCGPVGGGETGRTTAHFVSALDDRLSELERLHGVHGARLAAESHGAAIGYVENLVRRLAIDCGWRRLDGYLAVNERHGARRAELLADEAGAVRRAGLAVEEVRSLPAPWPAAMGPALRFPDQAQVHPLALLNAVARHMIASGVRIFTGTRARQVHGGADASVETDRGPIVRCRHVVVATNTPINNLVAVHTKQAGYQTYVMAFRVPAGVLPPLLLWDGLWEDDVSYHYLRLFAGDGAGQSATGDDLLIVGGEDHKTGQGPEGDAPFRCIEGWTRSRFPMCGPEERRWSGEVMEPADGLAYIGRNAVGHGNVSIVTGDSGNGMTHAAIAAMLIPDQILGRENPWSRLYDPARKIGLHALGDYAHENLNTLAQYGDWVRRGEARDEAEIPPGQGAVIARGLKHVAVYKDESGACTRLNATCTHLGGVVHWNSQEKTWDCPCHASRFDREGRVIHGPANTDLKPETAGSAGSKAGRQHAA